MKFPVLGMQLPRRPRRHSNGRRVKRFVKQILTITAPPATLNTLRAQGQRLAMKLSP